MPTTPAPGARRRKSAAIALGVIPLTALGTFGAVTLGSSLASASATPVALPAGATNDPTPQFHIATATPQQSINLTLDGVNGTADPTPASYLGASDAEGDWNIEWGVIGGAPLADGTYAYAFDIDGQRSLTGQFTVDTAAPAVTVTHEPGAVVHSRNVQFDFESSEPNTAWTVQVNGQAVPVASGQRGGFSSVYGEGENVVTIVATDAAGNASAPLERRFVVDTSIAEPDGDGPVITAVQTPLAIGGSNAQFVFETDVPATDWRYSVNGESFEPMPDGWLDLWGVDTYATEEGEVTVTVSAATADGSRSEPWTHTWQVVQVNSPQEVKLTQTGGPVTGDLTGADVTFSFTSPDPVGIWSFLLDGKAVKPGVPAGTLALQGLAAGEHELRAYAAGLGGNPSVDHKVVWTVEGGEPPVVTEPTPGDEHELPVVDAVAGGTVRIVASGRFDPNEPFSILYAHNEMSKERDLGDGVADAQGSVDVTVTLPKDAPVGVRWIILEAHSGWLMQPVNVVTSIPTPTPDPAPTEPATPPVVQQPGGEAAPDGTTPNGTTPNSTKPNETTPSERPSAVEYPNCAAVQAAGVGPVRVGQPGYSKRLDRDGDGVGCEQEQGSKKSYQAGDQVEVSGAGFTPNETVQVWLDGDGELLGTVLADAEGKVSTTVTLPATLSRGDHTLVLKGLASQHEVEAVAFTVAGGTLPISGGDLHLIAGAAAALALAGGASLVVARRRSAARR